MEVVEYEPEKAFGVVIKEGPLEMPGRVTFDSQGADQTAITISTNVPDSIDENLITSRMQRSARTIRDLIEAEL